MSPEMLERRLKYQTTSATAYNSVNIPGQWQYNIVSEIVALYLCELHYMTIY